MIRVLTFALTLALLLTGSTADAPAQSEAPPIKIGYAISRTGPFAPGAQVAQEPNYLLWAEQVNAAGGLNVKRQKRKIELISSDDRSVTETIVRTYESEVGWWRAVAALISCARTWCRRPISERDSGRSGRVCAGRPPWRAT
jgi:Periplasmic binding protein